MPVRIKRMLAGLIDFYILCFASTTVVAIVTLGELNMTPITLMIYLITFFLLVIFQDFIFKNASIGKRIFRIHIVAENSDALSPVTMIKRNLTKILAPLELLLILVNNRRMGDIWSHTNIVENTSSSTD